MKSLKGLEDFVKKREKYKERIEGLREKRNKLPFKEKLAAKKELDKVESEYRSISEDYIEIAEGLADFLEPNRSIVMALRKDFLIGQRSTLGIFLGAAASFLGVIALDAVGASLLGLGCTSFLSSRIREYKDLSIKQYFDSLKSRKIYENMIANSEKYVSYSEL